MKTVLSEKWEIIPLEKQKLAKSFAYAVLGLVAYFVAEYLTQFGLPEKFSSLAPFVPFVVNFLTKWAGEHRYKV